VLGIAYHPDFGGPIRYSFEDLPEHPYGQVSDTVTRLRENVCADLSGPYSFLIEEDVAEALQLGERGDRTLPFRVIAGLWQKIKSGIKFQHDEKTAAKLAIDDRHKIPDVVEVVIRPVDQSLLMRRMGHGVEDCDGFVGYAACVLTRAGIPCKFVTVSAEPEEPNRFSHIYLAAYIDGERIPLDFSHGPYPGWECPNAGLLKEWAVIEPPATQLCSSLAPVLAVTAAYFLYRLYQRRAIQ
jgi:hypothetical protein